MQHKELPGYTTELAHARAAYARARRALDNSRERLVGATNPMEAHRFSLTIADDWVQLGIAAAWVGDAMKADLEGQRQGAVAAA
jgi:hypothetical protein